MHLIIARAAVLGHGASQRRILSESHARIWTVRVLSGVGMSDLRATPKHAEQVRRQDPAADGP